MISLFLDTSSKYLTIAICRDNEQLFVYSEEGNNNLSRKVLPKINEILSKLSIDKKMIDNIYVVNGPGSFTGIRIGVTIAKVWAWTLKKNIFVISSLHALATTKVATKYIVPLIDARRGYVYAGIYQDGKSILKDQYILFSELKNKIDECTDGDISYVSYDDFLDVEVIRPNIDVSKLLGGKESLNPHKVNPNYLKNTEAEENLNK